MWASLVKKHHRHVKASTWRQRQKGGGGGGMRWGGGGRERERERERERVYHDGEISLARSRSKTHVGQRDFVHSLTNTTRLSLCTVILV